MRQAFWVDTGGASIRCERRGESGPLLVLLHEMGGCVESWDPMLERLGHSMRTLALDMRGAGLSEKPAGALTLDHLAADVVAVLDALGLREPVVLMGCAVGAATAVRVAVSHPARVAGLVLMSLATGVPEARRPETLALADRLEHEGVRPRVLERFDTTYPVHYFEGRSDRPGALGRLLQADPHSYAAAYRMLCLMDLTDELPKIAAPTLVLAGSGDRTRPPERLQAEAGRIPGARFGVVDSGHVMHVLTPELVIERLKDFLLDLPAVTRPLDENSSIEKLP
jgi:3-oxoadipate enol-lactonase